MPIPIYDVVQIVDVYPHHPEKQKQTMKIDPDAEAQSLSMLVNPLGREIRKIAIVDKNDERRMLAYQRAGYETHPMNNHRPMELRQFIRHMAAQIQQIQPAATVLVSDDPEFTYFCDAIKQHTKLSVWANSATVPRELTEPGYGFRPLEDLLPNLKIPRIDVRIDLENIFIGLVKRGWHPNLHHLIEAIREALKDLGEIVAITGYADWGELNRHHGGRNVNWQRELTLAGGESRYVVNQRGKNTADMKVVDDIRTLVEHEHSSGGAIDIIALATNDRDFRHIVETAKGRGKKVVLLALKGGLSRELEGVANDIRYLDGLISTEAVVREPQSAEVVLAMRIAAALKQNHWRFAKRDWLDKEFSSDAETLKRIIADGWLTATANSSVDGYGQARMLEFNMNNRYAKAAFSMVRWLPLRIDQGLRKMPYVDTNQLAHEMAHEWMFKQLNLARRRSAVENWLNAAASAGIVVAAQQPHPKNVSTVLTTWTLPQQQLVPVPPPVPLLPPAPSEIDEQVTAETQQAAPVHSISVHRLREMLTQGLSDEEVTRLLFDDFHEVYDVVGDAPKHMRIQKLLEYVDHRGLQGALFAAMVTINRSLDDNEWQPLAA